MFKEKQKLSLIIADHQNYLTLKYRQSAIYHSFTESGHSIYAYYICLNNIKFSCKETIQSKTS